MMAPSPTSLSTASTCISCSRQSIVVLDASYCGNLGSWLAISVWQLRCIGGSYSDYGMADELTMAADVMATPEQVLAAGGVSKRRRGASSSKRRSPSGQRRRAATPEPPKQWPSDPDEETEVKPEVSSTVRRISTTEKALIMKRSSSSPGEGRQCLPASEMKRAPESAESPEQTASKSDLPPAKRRSTAEKSLVMKRSHSSPGEDRQSLPLKQEPAVLAAPRKKHLCHGADGSNDISSAKSPSPAVTEVAKEEAISAEPAVETTNWHQESAQEGVKANTCEEIGRAESLRVKTPELECVPSTEEASEVSAAKEHVKPNREAVWGPFFRETRQEWNKFLCEHGEQWGKIIAQRNKCFGALVVLFLYCGLGGLVFRFTEGAFEAFYKCGVKRVKRDFVDSLWLGSHHLLEDEWKSQARRKLMELETQLHAAHEAGVTTYSGQRAWSFLNAVVYCLTVVTTIGYGHISPSTTTGRAITIVYAIFGIPMFLILLADFGKLFTRGIKFLWAFVRRVYYTGSCRKVRRTGPVQEVMKGVQLVYDFATFRRPSQMVGEPSTNVVRAPIARPEDVELQVPLNQNTQQTDGHEPPSTPALSAFEVDDEFNLPISVAIVILLVYIFVGAIIYWTWEDWGFFESFYFVFISMSTIGFGDFVPQHPMYMMASIVYLVFGLALTSMCINVVQEKLSDSFRQASAKIGATIGLRVNEEDGTITPVPPVQIEMPEVHGTIIKSQST